MGMYIVAAIGSMCAQAREIKVWEACEIKGEAHEIWVRKICGIKMGNVRDVLF